MLAMLWNGAKLILMGLLSVAVLFFFGGSEDNGGQSLHHSGSYEPAQLSAPADTGNGDKSWTVMMYLCGSDLESENGLATDNLKELCAANLGGRINYLIETGGAKRWNNNVVDSQHLNRYIVENGGITLKQQLASASMGEASTLSDFLKWGKSTYPADNYMLVFWDHGGGTLTGVCYDERYSHGSSDADTLTLPEIRAALKEANTQFEAVGFDTCLMSTLETAEVLKPYAKFMVGSEETEPGYGWDYNSWTSYLSAYPGIDGGTLGNINYYVKKGFLKTPVHYQFVLGASGGMPGNMDSLNYLLPKLPEGATWSITGIGHSHMACMLLGLANGCDGLRVGLEDNIYLSKGVLATNVQLVERAIKLAKDAGREIATAEDARQILGLTKHK